MTDFLKQLAAHHQRIDAALSHFISALPFQSSPLVAAMAHGALLGGKRLRPFLVYSTGRLFAIAQGSLDAPAAAVECIHAYSLIHDDLPAMDDDDLRRGQPTCHVRFGEDKAILAGDALQTLAFSILADAPMPGVSDRDRVAMISELARASGVAGMCGGQALDLEAEGLRVDLQTLERIHRHKTGALIRASVRLGALAAGERGCLALPYLDRYADAIGLAFQVQDDILDVIGDSATTGKRQGADQQLGKSTYPALLGLEQAQRKARELCQESLSALNELEKTLDTPAEIAPLRALANYVVERDK
ncbi:(2E,6E)-farnesyl diphosphate synthase [Dickeya chrysanthemi]|uniref:(2E,6E)-farnesyl diphosphate synthase n=1 Tax=Dickeya chrysanthemi TaxID=556 RepID=A0ABU8JHW9_DICCH|nr:(2E,6E)-farnesyl diphosphate synthase [Dickeya chrysanthemi]MBX9444557.1 (2E,6E)-farnesyl diphosphate synthase [Dickeya chrysanthemi]MCA7007984.1 (2E,6E)-farnesyl diphosphate synthase [Dickeya chrysanthemi]